MTATRGFRDVVRFSAAFVLIALALAEARAADNGGFTRREDVIYGRKDGMALTLDVFTPKQANGAGVIFVVSGGFFSSHEAINPFAYTPLLNRGYTVFAVVHGSQPRYTIPEAVADLNRATRYIRLHAKEFGIDPDRLGITGGSAGGHLSLMQGVAGDTGNPKAKDPIDRTSSRIQAVACFFPPTDFLNYGKEGNVDLGTKTLKFFRAPFEFREVDPQTHCYVPITEEKRVLDIARSVSPAFHVTKDDPPTLIIHGDADTLVPIQQAQLILEKFKQAGVPAELSVKTGAGHGWPDMLSDMNKIADWFDKYLAKPGK